MQVMLCFITTFPVEIVCFYCCCLQTHTCFPSRFFLSFFIATIVVYFSQSMVKKDMRKILFPREKVILLRNLLSCTSMSMFFLHKKADSCKV